MVNSRDDAAALQQLYKRRKDILLFNCTAAPIYFNTAAAAVADADAV